MSEWQIDEVQLSELNTVLQRADDVMVTNCMTRTAQESKLFPVLPYLMLVMIDAYFRFPDLLRAAAEHASPEDIGHRAREVSTTMSRLTGWATLNYYLNGRNLLIDKGLLRPEDNLEDLWFMVDFQQRLTRAFHRTEAHVWSLDAGDISQSHEERTLQVFEADAFALDEPLRSSVSRFLAAATQYNFLVHCESRSGLAAAGPYSLGGRRLMHTRDFLNMSECGLSWMDGVGESVSFNNLTVVLITDGVSIEITDWGTPYTTPEEYLNQIIGVGLYTSDFLCDRYQPVGMGSAAELKDTFEQLTTEIQQATRLLYSRFAEMTFDQMVEAGMSTYFRAPVEISMMAGVYEQSQWDLVDDRTRRLWPIYSEEFSLDDYVGVLAANRSTRSEYYLHPVSYSIWRRGDRSGDLPAPASNATLVPASVLYDGDYPRRVNPGGLADIHGSWNLPAKTGGYTFACGRLSEQEMNERARSFSSPLLNAPWRHLDEQTIKWRWREPEVDSLYRYAQEHSRLLSDRGSALRREDIERIRSEADEPQWSETRPAPGTMPPVPAPALADLPVPSALVLHALRIKGLAGLEPLVCATGLDRLEISEAVEVLAAQELALERMSEKSSGWALTAAGRSAAERRLAATSTPAGLVEIAELYERFLAHNAQVKRLSAQWQTTTEEHRRFDLIDELEEIHERVASVFEALAGPTARFGRYGARLQSALDRLLEDNRYFVSPQVDSYHSIWFECHEDFLLTLGRTRAGEGSE